MSAGRDDASARARSLMRGGVLQSIEYLPLVRRVPASIAAKVQSLVEGGTPPVPRRINLVRQKNIRWDVRDQALAPTCTAYAALASLELMDARPNEEEAPFYSAAFAYHFMRLSAMASDEPFDGKDKGYTRLKDAVQVFKQYGVCTEAVWPSTNTEAPGEAEKASAAGHRISDISYCSYPHEDTIPGLANVIYEELLADRPVAVTMPVYENAANNATNWDYALTHGWVRIPEADQVLNNELAHAVCIVGYLPFDMRETVPATIVRDGTFIFRNSYGHAFNTENVGLVPAGYGLLPAALLEMCCWQAMFMTKEPPSIPA